MKEAFEHEASLQHIIDMSHHFLQYLRRRRFRRQQLRHQLQHQMAIKMRHFHNIVHGEIALRPHVIVVEVLVRALQRDQNNVQHARGFVRITRDIFLHIRHIFRDKCLQQRRQIRVSEASDAEHDTLVIERQLKRVRSHGDLRVPIRGIEIDELQPNLGVQRMNGAIINQGRDIQQIDVNAWRGEFRVWFIPNINRCFVHDFHRQFIAAAVMRTLMVCCHFLQIDELNMLQIARIRFALQNVRIQRRNHQRQCAIFSIDSIDIRPSMQQLSADFCTSKSNLEKRFQFIEFRALKLIIGVVHNDMSRLRHKPQHLHHERDIQRESLRRHIQRRVQQIGAIAVLHSFRQRRHHRVRVLLDERVIVEEERVDARVLGKIQIILLRQRVVMRGSLQQQAQIFEQIKRDLVEMLFAAIRQLKRDGSARPICLVVERIAIHGCDI
mmetsp:Transcript_54345/g.89994  ORF Transcript_54345/g.89994 Transcript_54345/m.89994 type:complete len:439 (+) Transcript_54345:648-1964(+)